MHVADTIAAIASAAGGAARGIVRISGPDAIVLAAAGFRSSSGAAPGDLKQPTALVGELVLSELHSPLPATLYCWPDQRSYTRQPTVEIHTLGSPPLLELVLRHALASGARLAQPGEFTLRAFLAGRLDLMQAEAVLGLIDARHERQFQTALAQLAGGLSTPLARLREQLLQLLAHLEAGLDFATEDIEFITAAELDSQLRIAQQHVEAVIAQMDKRHTSDERPRVVLYGWPNVGKSSLFNAMVGQRRAIVSPQAGTTRDYLHADIDTHGQAWRLIDTAGVESVESPGTIGAAAQHMRHEQQDESQINLLCIDSTRPLNDWERQELSSHDANRRIVAVTKADCAANVSDAPPTAVVTSATTGRGLNQLLAQIQERLVVDAAGDASLASTAARCGEGLRGAAACLSRAREVAGGGCEELVAAELRGALTELGKVVGAVYTDDVLDRIFSRFCIGK